MKSIRRRPKPKYCYNNPSSKVNAEARFFTPLIESLEKRLLLSISGSLSDWFEQHPNSTGLFYDKNGNFAKPYILYQVDLLPVIGALGGAALDGVGAAAGIAAAKVVGEFGHLDGYVAIDGDDLIGQDALGKWLTKDASEDYITVSLGYSAAFGLSAGLESLAHIGGSLNFVHVPNPDSDPSLTNVSFLTVGGILGGQISSDVASVSLVDATQELYTKEIHRSEVIASMKAGIGGDFGLENAAVSTLVHDALVGSLRDVTTDNGPALNSPDPNPIQMSTGGMCVLTLDSNTSGRSVDLTSTGTGTLIVNVNGINNPFNGLVTLADSNKKVLVSTHGLGAQADGTLAYNGVLPGQEYSVSVVGLGQAQSAVVSAAIKNSSQGDPTLISPPPRVFGDAAGSDFDHARTVAVDRSNKGDDSGRINPKDDPDFYKFVAQLTGKVQIDVDPSGGLVTVATLYDKQKDANHDGKPDGVDSDPSDNDGVSKFVYDVVKNGIYYVGIESKNHASVGSYDIHVKPYDPAKKPGGDATDGPPGPLEGWGGVRGVHITLNNGGGQSRDSIDDPGQVDWYQIDGAQAGYVQVVVAGVNDDLMPFLTAFRANGGGIDTDSGESGIDARVTFSVGAGERIIVAVSSVHGSTGAYTIKISQPTSPQSDDYPNYGQTPQDVTPRETDEGFGYLTGKIETTSDNDWFAIPVRGAGYMTVQVDQSQSSLVSFLELNKTGGDSGWFETDDGRDGTAQITFLPDPGQHVVYARISSLDGTQGPYTLNVWRSSDPHDDHPDSAGRGGQPYPLTATQPVVIHGSIESPNDIDAFRLVTAGSQPVAIQVISLTPGFVPKLEDGWFQADGNHNSNTDGGSGRGGRTFDLISDIQAGSDVNINIKSLESESFGDYILYVWQIQTKGDMDADTVGIQASPILLDGSGNGQLSGSSPGGALALDFPSDADVFQVVAAAPRPITFTVGNQGTGLPTFLTVYNASGIPIGTDQNSGPNGLSQVTVEADRGQLFYLKVTSSDGTSFGAYGITVSQDRDDFPDVPRFSPLIPDGAPIALRADGSGTTTGKIDIVGDRDVFQVLVTAPGQLTIDVATTDNTLDTFVRVYDSRGTVVASDDDSGGGRDSHLVFRTFAGETYQIEVSGYADNTVGAYKVTVETSPVPRQTFLGTYDEGSSTTLDESKWNTQWQNGAGNEQTASGNGSVQQANGKIQLTAQGTGASEQSNSALLVSRATVLDDLDFDFSALVPTGDPALNENVIELTDGTNALGYAMIPDGTGRVLIQIESTGYGSPTASSTLVVDQVSDHHAHIAVTDTTTELYVDTTLIARFAAPPRPNSVIRATTLAQRIAPYDDFNGSSLDPNRWLFEQDSTGQGISEAGGRLTLYATANSNARVQWVSTENNSVGHSIYGATWYQEYLDGPGEHMDHYAALTDGIGNYIELAINSNGGPGFWLLLGGKYGSGTVASWSGRSGIVDIQQVDGNIEIRFNGELKYTIANTQLAPNSYFFARADFKGDNADGYGDKRMVLDDLSFYRIPPAQLRLDNVAGTFGLPPDAQPVLYDTFTGGAIDATTWHVTGSAWQQDGVLHSPLFEAGQPVNGSISTAGIPGGTGLRGFSLGASRTADPNKINIPDLEAWVEITNGLDYIRIRWDLQFNRLQVEVHGGYLLPGAPSIYFFDIPDGQVLDGPMEVRERDGMIEVLHNSTVQVQIPGTIRAGSYFTFQTDGDPFTKNNKLGSQDFDVSIDNLVLFEDPKVTAIRVDPSLAADSDSGSSNSDQITNKTTLTFQWVAGPDGTKYQVRDGVLQPDNTITWNDDYSAPQTGTNAEVLTVPGKTEVFAVRTIDANGIVGDPSLRGFVTDTTAPQGPSQERLDPTSDPNGMGVTVTSSPTLLWAAATDDYSLAGYEWRLDRGAWSSLQVNSSVTLSALSMGTHTLDVKAIDLAGNEGQVASDLFVVDVAPTVTAGLDTIIQTGQTFSRQGSFTDPGDDTWTATVDYGDGSGSQTLALNAGKSFALNHLYATGGAFEVMVKVLDDKGAIGTATFQIIVNDSPRVMAGPNAIVQFGQNFSQAGSFSDPNDDQWTATVSYGDGSGTVPLTLSDDKSFTLSHGYAASGVYAVVVQVTDSNGGSGLDILNVAVTSDLDAPSKLPIAANKITHSAEAYQYFITGAYQRYLSRTPDGTGLSFWVGQMQHGLTDEALEAGFLGSPEYYSHSGGTDASWIAGMYHDLLGRSPDQNGLHYWVGRLADGADRGIVSLGFAASPERETQRINDDYFTYLGRNADPGGLSFWLNRFLDGSTNEDLIAGFVGSREYFNASDKGRGDVKSWVQAVYLDDLHRAAKSGDIAFWSDFLR